MYLCIKTKNREVIYENSKIYKEKKWEIPIITRK